MKRYAIPALLLAAALIVGMGLPSLVASVQDSRSSQLESAGIQQVSLSVGSGMSHMKKLAVLSDPDCTLVNVGVGQHQTPSSLSGHSWTLLERIINDYGAPILDGSTTQQVEQFAVMASVNNTPFIFWEVHFTDGQGRQLRLYLDDETGLPLAMSCTYGKESADAERTYSHCLASLYALNDLCGVSAQEPEYEGGSDGSWELTITDGETVCALPVRLEETRFSIGSRID